MKILYIANYKGCVGGISGQVSLLDKYMREEGHETCIFSTIGNLITRLYRFMQLLVVARKYDILHIHGCSDRGFLPIVYGIIAGKFWNKRIIVTYHGGNALHFLAKKGIFVKKWLNKANQIVVLNGFLENIFREYEIPCQVIPNILECKEKNVTIDSLSIEQLKRKWGARFISVRHLKDLYNIPCILRAFEQVQRVIPDASLTILGEGEQRKLLEHFVIEHHLNNVCFVGQVPQYEIQHYLAQANIMLSAPRIDNMPISIMEAMQHGLLIISSCVGGIPYVLTDDETGLLFESDNDEELAVKMIWAVEHPEQAIRIVIAASEDVKKYSWDVIAPQIRNLYGI